MRNRDGLENNDNWATPNWLYKRLDYEFHFDFDPCPLFHDFDGLEVEWGSSNYVNPPYNRVDKPKFIKKAYDEWCKGKTCVMLLPASTGTNDFHNYIWDDVRNCARQGVEVRFLHGRVAFKGYNTKGEYTETKKGKHDSMIVIFRGTP